jgi:hypothetical protein
MLLDRQEVPESADIVSEVKISKYSMMSSMSTSTATSPAPARSTYKHTSGELPRKHKVLSRTASFVELHQLRCRRPISFCWSIRANSTLCVSSTDAVLRSFGSGPATTIVLAFFVAFGVAFSDTDCLFRFCDAGLEGDVLISCEVPFVMASWRFSISGDWEGRAGG